MTKPTLYQTLWTLAVTLSLAGSAFAVEPGSPPERKGVRPGGGGMLFERIQEAVNSLDLTDDQKSKLTSVLSEAKADFQKMRPELEALEPQDRMKQVGQFLEGVRADIKAVLTPEQKTEFDKKVEQNMRQLRERFGGRADGRNATTRPAGQPSAGQPPAAGRGAEGMAERLQENLQKLDLTEEQQAKVKALFEELKVKGDELRGQAQSDVGGAREGLRSLMEETRGKLREILTPEQAGKLIGLMAAPVPDAPKKDRPRKERKEKKKGAADDDKEMMQSKDQMQMSDDMMSSSKPKSESVKAAIDEPLPAGPSVGDAAPELSLKRLDGSALQLSALKGRVVVLVFGSYSSPAFRQRVASLEKLENETEGKAQFFVVYTKEAHAKGEWEVDRNKLDEISVDQPTDADARIALAKTAREKLKLTVPIAVDTMENQAVKAFGAGQTSAYVIGRDGTIATRQQWFEASALRRAIAQATASAPTTRPG